MNNDFDTIFQDVGQKYGIDPDFLKAHSMYESGLDPKFKNPDSSASGLGAFTDATAKDYGVDRNDPRSSIEGQAKYLKANYDKFGDSTQALSAYKTGPNGSGHVDQNYVDGVMNIYNDLKSNKQASPNTSSSSNTLAPEDKVAAKLNGYAATGNSQEDISPKSMSQTPEDRMAAKLASYNVMPSPTTSMTVPENGPQSYDSMLANAKAAVPNGGNKGEVPLSAIPGVVGDMVQGKNTQDVPAALESYATNIEKAIPGMHEAGSAIAAGLGQGQGDTFGQRYNNLEQSQQAMRQAGEETNPIATAIGQVGAGLATTPLLPSFEDGPTLPGKVLAGIGTGAGYGAAYGAGNGDANKDIKGNVELRLENAAKGAGVGSAFGAAVPAALGTGAGVANALTRNATPEMENATNAIHDIIGQPVTQLDTTEYVPGVTPTLANAAAYGGDKNAGNVAALEKTLSESKVGGDELYNQAFADKTIANKDLHRNYVMGLTGSTDDLSKAYKDRSAIAKNMLEDSSSSPAIWNDPAAKPADVKPVVDTINNILQGPDRGNDAVVKTLGNLKDKLVDSQGNPETDPQYLYKSVIKTINTWQDKNHPANELSQLAKAASPQVSQVKDVLNQAIKQSVPKYGDYLSAYSAASKPIDQMETLQGLKLVNPESDGSSPTLIKVNNALQKIAQERSQPGTNPYKSLTPDHINALRNLQSSLEREQSAQNLLQTKGSPTSQNLQFVSKVKGALGANKPIWPRTVGASLGSSLGGVGYAIGLPETVSGAMGMAGAGAGERLGDVVANRIAAKGSKKAEDVANLLLQPQNYKTASAAKSGLANNINPFNGNGTTGKFFKGTNYTPALGYGANQLLQLANPSNP